MSICKIGETKVINGVLCRKVKPIKRGDCKGCYFFSGETVECPAKGGSTDRNVGRSIESGGCECRNSIWILADDQPEAPAATTPRDEVREQRRFQAAVAAMQGLCANRDLALGSASLVSRWAVEQADSLLAELDRTGAK